MFVKIINSLLLIYSVFLIGGCDRVQRCSSKATCEKLDSIEALMFQRPESLVSLLTELDTTYMTPHERARLGTIRGMFHFENGLYDRSIQELGKAETYFFNQQDHFHLHICKLIKAFTFEYLELHHNASSLYIECENYFDVHDHPKIKFYATLGLFRMAKSLKLDEKILLDRLQKAAIQLNEPSYNGLLYATMGVLVKNDSLKNNYYEKAKSELISEYRWSRVYAIDLNLLFVKIRQDPSENAQVYYNNFSNKSSNYIPNVLEKMRYKYAQAYLYAKQGKDQLSIEVANKVLSEAVRLKITKVESDCVELLAYLYKRTGDFANAHQMLERFQSIRQKRMDALQKNQLLAMGTHYRYSELEREKLELRIKIQRYLLIFGLIGLIFIFVILILWISWKKSKHKQEVLKLKNMVIKDQISKLQRSLDNQESENAKLKQQAEELIQQYNDSLSISEFLKAIDQNKIKTWMEYESLFHVLRPGWIEKLKQTVPELTPTDLKYCMCFYFNLSNYTIANLCETGVEAIKGAKKRIRDKFSLNDATEIYIFLINIQ